MGKMTNNPALNEFVYTALYQSSMEERRGLRGKYLKIAMSAKASKTFATTSTREEKEYILSHFGFEFAYIIFKRGTTLLKFKQIFEKFEKKRKAAALSDIAQDGMFVTTDKEFMRLLGHVSQSIHHPAYFLNLELNRQGYHIQKWPKKFANQDDMASREVDMSAKLLVKTCLSANLVMDYCEGSTGIRPLELKILLYLYTLSQIYVPEEKIFAVFAGAITTNKFRRAIRAVSLDHLILKNAKEKEYTITAAGIRQVNEYVNRIMNLNTF